MYRIEVEGHFDAAHFLRGYKGKCETLHGHRFKVVVRLNSSQLNEIGIAYDFTELKKHLTDVLSRFDHTCLNDVPPFDKINPSSENLSHTIFEELKTRLVGAPAQLAAVEVWESPESRATYSED